MSYIGIYFGWLTSSLNHLWLFQCAKKKREKELEGIRGDPTGWVRGRSVWRREYQSWHLVWSVSLGVEDIEKVFFALETSIRLSKKEENYQAEFCVICLDDPNQELLMRVKAGGMQSSPMRRISFWSGNLVMWLPQLQIPFLGLVIKLESIDCVNKLYWNSPSL